MKIDCRRTSKYLEVIITDGSTSHNLGLLDDKERIALADIFSEAVSDLLYGISTDNVESELFEGTNDALDKLTINQE